MNTITALKARRPERSGLPAEPAIRLLIVDDSSVARAVLSRIIGSQPGFEVVAAAGSVAEALDLLGKIVVDVVLLDIEMPGENGLEAIPSILDAGRGARIMMVSSRIEEGAEVAVRALALGATDAMPKPVSSTFGGRFSEQLGERLRRIGRVAGVRETSGSPKGKPVRLREVAEWKPACIAIGASTGGIHAINAFLGELPRGLGVPIFVTQHLPPLFMRHFAKQLESAAGRPASVVANEDVVEPDRIYLAPGDAHLRLLKRGATVQVKLDRTPMPSGCLPSVDPMFASVAEVYGRGGIGVILSGMGRDGLAGSGDLVRNGGIILAQDQHSCAIWGMPRAVAEAGLASAILPPRELAMRLLQRAGEPAWT